ncbi:MAG TPA: hypothetical protein VNY36_05930 [Bacteroidia bacterium]|jgi:hypothetical protein|nr:hypothetical protein [Bacteroidia bacterium]
MKPFLIILISLCFTLTIGFTSCAKVIRDSGYSVNDSVIHWSDVIVKDGDTSKEHMVNRGKRDGYLFRRQTVHSIKDLNKAELKQIKEEAAKYSITVVYILIKDKEEYNSSVYYYFFAF